MDRKIMVALATKSQRHKEITKKSKSALCTFVSLSLRGKNCVLTLEKLYL